MSFELNIVCLLIRYSFLGAMPAMEIIATQNKVTVLDHEKGTRSVTQEHDPMRVGVQRGVDIKSFNAIE